MMHFKRILVPTDFSEGSVPALKTAIALAEVEPGSTIFILHVLSRVVDTSYTVNWTEDLIQLRINQAKKDLLEWRKKVPISIRRVAILGKGRLAEEIHRVCKEESIDLVIMTTRGRRGVARIIHPNASEKTVRLAPCPVLVLPLNRL
jgi:nucleotide-binding universal stress UspA family protein